VIEELKPVFGLECPLYRGAAPLTGLRWEDQ